MNDERTYSTRELAAVLQLDDRSLTRVVKRLTRIAHTLGIKYQKVPLDLGGRGIAWTRPQIIQLAVAHALAPNPDREHHTRYRDITTYVHQLAATLRLMTPHLMVIVDGGASLFAPQHGHDDDQVGPEHAAIAYLVTQAAHGHLVRYLDLRPIYNRIDNLDQ